MEISDDEANMIAGRIFDAIESKGLFNRQLVATEIKAGLALVKAPVKRTSEHEATLACYQREYIANFVQWSRESAVNPPAFYGVDPASGPGHSVGRIATKPAEPSETERQIVKEIQELLGMPLSPGKRDPDGTAHYRLPDTRKAAKDLRRVRVSGVTYAVTPPYPMDDYAAQVEILRWLDAYGEPPTWATPI